ncbi:YoaP domain-containing protein [Halosquirtibacter xylanolyticus]|uniref:N-acetyltransferase n=1 Tax=Halosquirtibacter xylanolyticus TaxID=3374599 RepID=UPI003747ECBB|nr:YoaP domain-containing protein [Prolixibacteraceae bacterium]
MADFILLSKENIDKEHICCAISDKKCKESYELKKSWLKKELDNGYVFRRIDARAKVFIEYGPAEKAWLPIDAPNYININCFWVSGRYKGHGNARKLLQYAIDDAKAQGKLGLVTVVGTKKFHFMSDTKWLLRQGFEVFEKLSYGFSLLVLKFDKSGTNPTFKQSVQSGMCPLDDGITVYYTNRCPFSEYHVSTSLVETTKRRKIPLHIRKLETLSEAQEAPTPATIFSLFYNGQFVTTDISICMDRRFDMLMDKFIAAKKK